LAKRNHPNPSFKKEGLKDTLCGGEHTRESGGSKRTQRVPTLACPERLPKQAVEGLDTNGWAINHAFNAIDYRKYRITIENHHLTDSKIC